MEHEEEHTHYHGVDKAEEHLAYREAVKLLLDQISPTGSESIALRLATGRILATDVTSPMDIPHLAKSTRDGYAVDIPNDTSDGARFNVVGELRIGVIPKLRVKEGEAVSIATGAFLPSGANAVLMKEYAKREGNTIVSTRQIRINENTLSKGEDVNKGKVLLSKGTRIRPHHVALLSMVGAKKVRVYRKPKVAFFSTGDELVDSESQIKENKIYDGTRPFIKSMLEEMGAEPVDLGIAKDDFKVIRSKMLRGLRYDALLLSAGSSVGERDFVSRAASSVKGVRMLVHGIAMRPSSPTGLAVYKKRPFILLPGFPTSAIVSFLALARPAILKRSGSSEIGYTMVRAKMAEGFQTRPGLTQFLRVRVERENEAYSATIVRPTEAQYSGWLASANGIAVIGSDRSEIKPGDSVDVFLIGDIAS